VDTGSLEPQSAGPFTNASLAGSFYGGTAEVVTQNVQAEVEPITPNGNGSITGVMEADSMSTQDAGSSFLAATYSVNSDGTFNAGSSGSAVAGIIISSTKFLLFSPSTAPTAYPTLLILQK